MDNNDRPGSGLPDAFDRQIGQLDGLPDVIVAKPTTVRTITPLIGVANTYIVQTYRQRDVGDTIFMECVSAERSFRLAIPPRVADVIARQRDALTSIARRKAARAAAADRKARGIQPAFLRGRGKGEGKGKGSA